MKPKPGQTIVYRDELTDDFFETRTNRTVSVTGTTAISRKIPFSVFSPFWRITAWRFRFCGCTEN